MASRRDIREAFYSALEAAVPAAIDASDITQEYPDPDTDAAALPQVVHNDNYRKVPMNRGAAPARVEYTGGGDEDVYRYASMMEARFTVTMISEDEQLKEDVYEDVRRYFEKFQHPPWDESSIQEDVHSVEVTDSTSQDREDREPTARADRLSITLGFTRFYDADVESVDTIDRSVDDA